ncbi:MAG TPA: tetratricopeptide repeat protein [Vicinamibacterales bacterium]|nr:tetratricopeptide repeat protein [Vicinamibacterales bacterium]
MRLRVALLLAAGLVVYWNARPAPFILDDVTAITSNPSIRTLSPISVPLDPPSETPVAGRPIVNLTLAANYAYGDLDPRGYHVVNLAIHLLAALALLGIVRRTLLLPGLAFPAATADVLAWVAALVWMLHPLNSEVVDYVTERSESLMGLFYLLALYCAIRAWATVEVQPSLRGKRRASTSPPVSGPAPRWEIAAVACCAAGMLCKESMVTAPVAVMLYDRIFRFDSFASAVRSRARLYAALALCWVVPVLVLVSGVRSTAGFATGVSPATYFLNQLRLIPHYLLLTVWPRALVVDYGLPQALSVHDVLVPALVLAVFVVAAVVCFVRAPRLGFGLLFFFLTLGPTSSIVPIATEVGAERRMYLPLAGLVASVVVAAYLLLRRAPRAVRIAVPCVVCVLAAAGTYARNREYTDPLVIARTAATRWPSGRSHFFYGTELIAAGHRDEGIAEFRRSAVDYPGGHFALGGELIGEGRLDEGLAELREYIRLDPKNTAVAPARVLMGRVLQSRGQLDAAAEQFTTALAHDPRNVRALVSLGDVRLQQGRSTDAIDAYQRAQKIDPAFDGDDTVMGRLASALASANRMDEAAAAAQQAVEQQPENPVLQKILGRILAASGRIRDAIPHFQRAVELAPSDAQARAFLAAAESEAAASPH